MQSIDQVVLQENSKKETEKRFSFFATASAIKRKEKASIEDTMVSLRRLVPTYSSAKADKNELDVLSHLTAVDSGREERRRQRSVIFLLKFKRN